MPGVRDKLYTLRKQTKVSLSVRSNVHIIQRKNNYVNTISAIEETVDFPPALLC